MAWNPDDELNPDEPNVNPEDAVADAPTPSPRPMPANQFDAAFRPDALPGETGEDHSARLEKLAAMGAIGRPEGMTDEQATRLNVSVAEHGVRDAERQAAAQQRDAERQAAAQQRQARAADVAGRREAAAGLAAQKKAEAGRLKYLKSTGVQTTVAPDGTETVALNDDGTLKKQAGFIGKSYYNAESGRWVRDYQPENGDPIPKDLEHEGKLHRDAETGERYYEEDGVRHDIGVDEHWQKRQEATLEVDSLRAKHDKARVELRRMEDQRAFEATKQLYDASGNVTDAADGVPFSVLKSSRDKAKVAYDAARKNVENLALANGGKVEPIVQQTLEARKAEFDTADAAYRAPASSIHAQELAIKQQTDLKNALDKDTAEKAANLKLLNRTRYAPKTATAPMMVQFEETRDGVIGELKAAQGARAKAVEDLTTLRDKAMLKPEVAAKVPELEARVAAADEGVRQAAVKAMGFTKLAGEVRDASLALDAAHEAAEPKLAAISQARRKAFADAALAPEGAGDWQKVEQAFVKARAAVNEPLAAAREAAKAAHAKLLDTFKTPEAWAASETMGIAAAEISSKANEWAGRSGGSVLEGTVLALDAARKVSPMVDGQSADAMYERAKAALARGGTLDLAGPDAVSEVGKVTLEVPLNPLQRDIANVNASHENQRDAKRALRQAAEKLVEARDVGGKQNNFGGQWGQALKDLTNPDEAMVRIHERESKLQEDIAKIEAQEKADGASHGFKRFMAQTNSTLGGIASELTRFTLGRSAAQVMRTREAEAAQQLIGNLDAAGAEQVFKAWPEMEKQWEAGKSVMSAEQRAAHEKAVAEGKASWVTMDDGNQRLRLLGSGKQKGALMSLNLTLGGAESLIRELEAGKFGAQATATGNAFYQALIGVGAGNIEVDENNPQEVAQRAFLSEKLAKVVDDKLHWSNVIAAGGGSMLSFMGAGLVGRLAEARLAAGGVESAMALNLTRGGITGGMYGTDISMKGSDRSMGAFNRLADIASEGVPLMLSERWGDFLGEKVAHKLSTLGKSPWAQSAGKFAGRMAGLGGGEMTSDVLQNMMQGQSPFEGWAESLVGSGGMIGLGGALLGTITDRWNRPKGGRAMAGRWEAMHEALDAARTTLDAANQSNDPVAMGVAQGAAGTALDAIHEETGRLLAVSPAASRNLGNLIGVESRALAPALSSNPHLQVAAVAMGAEGRDIWLPGNKQQAAKMIVEKEGGFDKESEGLGQAVINAHVGAAMARDLADVAEKGRQLAPDKAAKLAELGLVAQAEDGRLVVTEQAVPLLPAALRKAIAAAPAKFNVVITGGAMESANHALKLADQGLDILVNATRRVTAAAGEAVRRAAARSGAAGTSNVQRPTSNVQGGNAAQSGTWNVEAVDAQGNVATFTVPGGNEAAARVKAAERKGPGWTIQSIAPVAVDGGAGSESAVGDENSPASATQGAVQGAAQGKGGQGNAAASAGDELLPVRNAGQAAGTGGGNTGGAAVGAAGAHSGATAGGAAGSAGGAKFYTGLGKNGQAGKRLAALERAGVKVIQTKGHTLARLNADGTTTIEINPAAFVSPAHEEAAVGEEIIHHFDNELMAAEWRKAVADGTFQGDAQEYRADRIAEIFHDLRSRIGGMADAAERKAMEDAVVAAFNLYYGKLKADAPLATTVDGALQQIADVLYIEGTPYQASVFTYAMELKRMLDQARADGEITEQTHELFVLGQIGAWVRDAIAAIKALAAKLLEMGHPLHASEMSKLARDAEALMAGTFAKGGTDVGGNAVAGVQIGGRTVATGGAWASKASPDKPDLARGAWAMVPLDELEVNTAFNAEQNRIGGTDTPEREGTRKKMIANMTPESLPVVWLNSPHLSEGGAPVMRQSGSIPVGNNRTKALREMYAQAAFEQKNGEINGYFTKRAKAYEAFVREQAAAAGLDATAFTGKPVVWVRVLSDNAEIDSDIVEAGNAPAADPLNPATLANQDAAAFQNADLLSLLTFTEDGTLTNEFLFEFGRAIGSPKGTKNSKGQWDVAALKVRAQNAMLATMIGQMPNYETVLAKLVNEREDEGNRRTMQGVFRALPGLIKIQTFNPQAGILTELGRAISSLADFRQGKGKSWNTIAQFLANRELPGFEQKLDGKLLGYLAEGHSAAEIAKELGDYVAKVVAQGDPAQDQMFAAPAVDKATMGGVLAKPAEGSAQWSVLSAQKQKRLAVLSKKGKLTASEEWEKAALERSAGQKFIPGAEGPAFALDRETAAAELKSALSDGMEQMQLLAKPNESLAGAELDETRIPRSVRMAERTGHAIFEDWVHRDMEQNGSTHAEALAKFSFEDAVAVARQRMAPLLAKMAEQPELLDPSGAPGDGVRRYRLNQDRQLKMPAEIPGVEQPPPVPQTGALSREHEPAGPSAFVQWQADMEAWLARYNGPLVFSPVREDRERVGFVSKTPSTGKWRLTHFQWQQPSGHTDYDSKMDALEDAIRYYRRVDPGAVFAKPNEQRQDGSRGDAEAQRADGGRSAVPVNVAADLDPRFWSYRPRFILDRSIAVVQKVLAKLDELLGTNLTRFFKLKTADVVFMVKPLGKELGGVEKVRAFLRKNGGVIAEEWTGIVDAQRISEHYKNSAGKAFFPEMVKYMVGREVTAFRVKVDGSKIPELRKLIGDAQIAPGTLRAEIVEGAPWKELYKEHGALDNGLHLSDSLGEGARESNVWFGIPPIVEGSAGAVATHKHLWNTLKKLCPSIRFGGSAYNGTAVPGKMDDLDYMLLAPDVAAMRDAVGKIPGLRLETPDGAVDPTSGTKYYKFEYDFPGGKADIAVVDQEAYRWFIHHNALAKYFPAQWKQEMIAEKKRTYDAVSVAEAANGKASAERKAAKAAYESVKRNYYAQVRRFFRLDELWDKALPDETVPEAAVSARLASLPEGTRELASRALALLDPKTRGHILKRALTYPMPAMPDAVRAAVQEPPAPVHTEVAPTMEDVGNRGAQILNALGDRAEIRWEKNGAVTESPKDHFRQPVNGYQHLLIQSKDGERIHVTTPEMAVLRYFGKGEQAAKRIAAALAVEARGGAEAAEAKAYRAMIGVSLTDYYASALLAQASRTNSSNLSRSIWTPPLLSSMNEKFGKPGSSNRLQPKSSNASYATGINDGRTPTTKNSTSIENSGSGGAFIQSEDTENAPRRQPGEENKQAQTQVFAKHAERAGEPTLFDMLPVRAAAQAYVASLPDKKPAAVKKAAVRDGMREHADDLFDFAEKNPPKLTGTQQTRKLSTHETSDRHPATAHGRPSAESAPSVALDDLFSLMAGKREAERGAGAHGDTGGAVAGSGQSDLGGDGVSADGVSAGEATGPGQRGGGAEAGGSELGGRGERGGAGPRAGESADTGGDAADRGDASGVASALPPHSAELPPLVERPTDPDARNFVIPRGATIAPRGLITKLKANIKAVKLLKLIQGERRNATAEEKAELVKFTGWGALSQAFDEDKAGYVSGGHLERDRKDLARYKEMQQRDIDAGRTGDYYKDLVDRSEENIRGFENWEKKFGNYYAQIKEALTEPEWRRARASTINAHFTEGGVVSLMWDAVGRLGFRGGNVGEMALGVGHFYGLMPQELQDRSKLFGVEMDPISAGIAQLLYPEADIQNSAFQQADVADNSLDLNMGNVPFANIAIVDPAIKALDGPLDNLHDYYFAKMLQKTRPGGLICAISSAFTLDKLTATNRKWLAERADLVAAFRLPNDAFKENAGTDVVTDIIILRKKDGMPFEHGQAWTSLADSRTAKGEPIRVNEYFAAHPNNVLGLLADDGEMFAGREGAKEMTVHSDAARPADVALAQAIDSLPADIVGPGAGTKVRGGAAANSLKMGNIVKAASGHYHFNTGGEFSPEGMSESDAELNEPKNRPRVAGFIGVRDALNRQYELELSPVASEAAIEENRAELNRLYDAFKGRFEDFHHKSNRGLFIDDPDYFRLAGAEVEEKTKGGLKALVAMVRGKAAKKYVKADVFRKRVLAPRVEPTSADSIEDAMGMSLGWRGRVDVGYIAQLTGQTREQVEAALLEREIVLRDPSTGQIQSREQYLSGNVRKKLKIARASGEEFARNVKLLETAQPADVAIGDIKFSIGATWITPEMYREFMRSLGMDVTIQYHTAGAGSDQWTVEHPTITDRSAVRYKDFDSGGYAANDFMDALLNMRRIEVRDSARDGGKVNPERTAQAQNKANELKAEFERWARDTAGVGDRLAAIYNKEVNGFALRTYDGQHLTFPWASADFDIFPDKKNTVWRAIQDGFGLIAHGVGGGKTIVGSSIALEMRRLGLAKKPMIVVHNATLEQFADTIAQIAPAARVLVGRKDELQGAKRKEFLMRIAAGDWDAVVVAHSTFNLIADDPAFMRKQMENLVDELKEALLGQGYKDLGAAKDDRKKSASVKQMVKMLLQLEDKIEEASKRTTDTELLSFQQLGVDALIVDEVHKFKKMPFATKLDVKGIDGGMSKSGYGLLMRARGIQEKNGGRNVFTMTGTPVTNTLGEVWNQVRLVAPHLLKEYGIEKFDQFVSKFASLESKSEADPTGARKMVERLAKIINLPEWATFFRMAADVKFGEDMVTAGRPEVKGGAPELVAAERTKGATAWVNYIRQVLAAVPEARKEAMRAKDFETFNRINSIPVTAYMASRAAAIDIRLIEPRALDEPGSKVNLMLERAMGIYKQTGEYKGTQVIFADSMNPTRVTLFDEVMPLSGLQIPLDPLKEPGTTFHLYDDIRMKLIKRGVPASEIAVLTDKKYQGDSGEKAKKALWEKVNAGEVRFVLGSTEKLGTGVNMQRLMAAAHHLDVPWTPAGLEQRDGRVLRQGNLHMDMKIPIELIRYGMKDTLDEALWGILERKQRFITSALSGKLSGREIEEDPMTLDLGQQMAILSGPYGQEMFEVDNRLRELSYSRQAHEASVRRRTAEIADAKKEVRTVQAEKDGNEAKFKKLERLAAAVQKDGAQLTVDGETFETKKAMLDAVNRVIEEARADYEGKAETFRDTTVPVITSIVANGVPIRLTGRPFTQTIYGEEQQPIGERIALEFSLEGLPWSQKNAVSDHFGEVKSAATLLSRLDELGGRVQARRDAIARNLERFTALSEMKALGAWAYQDEFDRKTARAAELVNLMRGGGKTSEGIIAPQSMPLLAKPNEGAGDLGKLVMDNLGLAVSIARHYSNVTAPMEDVVSEARLALVKAARGWEPDKGPFGNYAARAIRNSLNSMFTGEGAQARAEMTTLDAPSGEQGAGSDETWKDNVSRNGAGEVTRPIEDRETHGAMQAAIAKLPEYPRSILFGLMEGRTMEDIAEEKGVSKQAISKVAQTARAAVKAIMQRAGFKGVDSDGVLLMKPNEAARNGVFKGYALGGQDAYGAKRVLKFPATTLGYHEWDSTNHPSNTRNKKWRYKNGVVFWVQHRPSETDLQDLEYELNRHGLKVTKHQDWASEEFLSKGVLDPEDSALDKGAVFAKPVQSASVGAGQGASVGGVLVESALDQAQIAREREATLKKLDPPTPGGTMMPGEKLSVMGDIYSFLFKGWKDAMERGAPGTKDAVDAGEIRAAKAAAATREMMERMMADARAGLEAMHGGKGKALFKQFAAELLPTASRLNATGVDVDGNLTFSTFDQRAGIIFKNQAEASGVTTGQWLERGTEFLKVGEYIEDAGGYQLLRELTPERQQAMYDTFMERFNGAGHYLTLWISPDMADARVTDSRGTVLPEFNRHALRKFFGEVSPHGELDAVEGYVPEIQRTRSLAGMIGQGVTNLLNKNFKSGAREYKSGQARETGEVKNLFEGFAIRAMEAHAERARREMAERLIPLAVKEIPAVGGVPSGWMAVNTHALPQLAQAYGSAMGMTKEQLVKWTNAVASQDMDALRKLCGAAWQDLTGNKMMRKEVFAALVRPMAATQSGSAIMRFFASMTRSAVAAFLVRPSTAFMNFVGNEVFKGMRLIQQAQVSLLLRKADPQAARVSASEAWNLTKGIITNRWFIPARRRMMDAVAPVEYSEGNSQIAGAAQSMTEAKMTAWEHLKQANVPAALLKLTRFGEMDPRAKQQLQFASLIAHAEVAAEDAEKQGFKFANRKQRMQWMQAWLAKQPDDLMVQARAVGLAYAMDYDNVPWWLDPGHRFAVGTVDMTPVVNVGRNLMLPYFRWTYNYLRNTKRWLGGGSADVVTWLGAKVASAPFLAGTEAGKRMKAAAEERGVPEMNPKLANSIANLGTFVLMQAAAYALLHLGRGGGDDDKDRVDRLGRSFDQAGKRMDRAFDTSSRMDISDIPVLGTATRALARMFGEQKDGDSYWLRTRQIPYASVLLATATSLDALGADKAHARGLATEAANMWREFASDLVSEGILMTVVNKIRGNESKYTGSQSVSTTLGGMATDFALARVAPQPMLSMVRDLVDPQQRRLTPNEKLGYEPGVVEGVKSRLPFASKTLPPAGKIKTKLLDNAVEELAQVQAKGHTNATNFGVNKDGKPTATFVDPADDRRLPRWKTLLGYGLVNIKPVDKAGYERAVHGEEGDYKREMRKAMLNGKR